MNDVCLILEGSYPYRTGGVSAWLHHLVRDLDDVRFTVAHLRDDDDPIPTPAYRPPPNVEIVDVPVDPERADVDAALVASLPDAGVYHALSTGQAGAAAARVAEQRGRPMLLTEHGLAWHEASIGLPSGCKPTRTRPHQTPDELRERAADIGAMAREAYTSADVITTVCASNARAQRAAGAPADRMHVLPNPVAPTPDAPAAPAGGAFRVGLVGRVVAVKDVATFLHAAAIVAAERPDASFAIVGPTDHEPAYVDRCRQLATELEIGDQVTFTGETDPSAWYPRLDAVALTSISEASPLALLEAMSHGRPVVATDVGGCAELVGDAGFIVPPRDPAAAAKALLWIAASPHLRRRLGAAGRLRTRAEHDPAAVHGAYHELYARALSA